MQKLQLDKNKNQAMNSITAKDLYTLRSQLPSGWNTQIRKKLKNKVTRQTIYNVMWGKNPDLHGIIHIALNIRDEYNKSQQEIKELINTPQPK